MRIFEHFLRRVVFDKGGFLGAILGIAKAVAPMAAGYFLNKAGKGKSHLSGFTLPEWFQDPYYEKTQDVLWDLSKNLLKGKIPEYYREIGETGGPQFQGMVDLINKQVTQQAQEIAAKQGRGRGGLIPSVSSRALADQLKQLSYKDFLRALEGKQWLLKTGIATGQNVRTAGLTNQSQRNSFNLGRSKLDLAYRGALDQQDIQSGNMLGGAIGSAADLLTKLPEIKKGIDTIFGGGVNTPATSAVEATKKFGSKGFVSNLGSILSSEGVLRKFAPEILSLPV